MKDRRLFNTILRFLYLIVLTYYYYFGWIILNFPTPYFCSFYQKKKDFFSLNNVAILAIELQNKHQTYHLWSMQHNTRFLCDL